MNVFCKVVSLIQRLNKQTKLAIIFMFIIQLVIFPLFCGQWRYSYYFRGDYEDLLKQLKYENKINSKIAQNYLNSIKQVSRTTDNNTSLVIAIVTVNRNKDNDNFYLTQVVAKLHELLEKCGTKCSSYKTLMCNVEFGNHKELHNLERIFPAVHRKEETKFREFNIFNKEKEDYIFCMRKSLEYGKPEYVLLLEDDAVPEDNFFTVLQHLLKYRLPSDFLYIKLYHPERLQQYFNPEPWRIGEWIGFGFFAGSMISAIYYIVTGVPDRFAGGWKYVMLFSVYSMIFVETMGRHYLLELRRISPHLFNIVPVTECCTQAMLYSSLSAETLSQYLSSVECQKEYAKDTVLYYYVQNTGMRAFVVEPNLVRHIGLESTLRD